MIIMNTLALYLFVIFAVINFTRCDQEKYTTKYDGMDIKEILNNKRLLNAYCNCLLDKGPCTPDGTELRRVLPDAIETECSKCSEKQREGAKIILPHLIEKEKDCWNQLEAKYDPEGLYRAKYKDYAEREGIKI